jgi:uncharacterized RDD family membrane protein YckC
MTCPSCGGELVEGADRCPVCDGGATPRVEGALAADPRLLTPPARPKSRPEPIREIPALRRQSKERSWRDEVQERMRSRRQKRVESGLPLFDGIEGQAEASPSAAAEAVAPDSTPAATPAAAPAAARARQAPGAGSAPQELGESVDPFPEKRWELEPKVEERAVPLATPPVVDATPLRGRRAAARDLELGDLPLASPEVVEPAGEAAELDALDRAISSRRRPMPSLEVDALGDDASDPEVELSAPAPEAAPVERPARPFERVQAAAVDLALFSLLAMVVVYFAGRAARVDVAALAGSWRWLAAYLGLLAVFYASYFTGTTGQTPGKLVTGLRVVGSTGRPPAYPMAAARAVAGLVGVAAAGLGCLPMAFDPAARALHDRLFHTRVVRG